MDNDNNNKSSFLNTKRKYDRLEGYLYNKVKGSFNSIKWKKRKFILYDKMIMCYDIDNNNKLKNSYSLCNAKIYTVDKPINNEDTNENIFMFIITYDDDNDTIELATESIELRELWIEAITECQFGGPLITIKPFYSFVPNIDLIVNYRSNDNINNVNNDGNEMIIDPSLMVNKPLIAYKPMSIHDVFTLILIDSVLSENNNEKLIILWMICDIHGSDISGGHELHSYIEPIPPQIEEVHRYSFILIKQAAALTPNHFQDLKLNFSTRDINDNNIKKFLDYIDNSLPSAIAIFRIHWDKDIIKTISLNNSKQEKKVSFEKSG